MQPNEANFRWALKQAGDNLVLHPHDFRQWWAGLGIGVF